MCTSHFDLSHLYLLSIQANANSVSLGVNQSQVFSLSGVIGTSHFLCLICAGVHVEPYVQAQSGTHPFCGITRSSCEFYSHCIELAFQCGSQGFILSYARHRCSVVRRLRPFGTSNYTVSRAARNWARNTELCLHTKLLSLLDRYPNMYPDPQLCLDWEMDAVAELNSCYTDESSAAAFLQLPDADIRKLVNLFRISDYYSPTVDASLVELVRTRSSTLASEVVRNHTLSSRHRIILCIKGTKYLNGLTEVMPSPEDYVRVVSNELAAEEREYFHYAGPDQLADMDTVGGLCYDRSSDIDVSALDNDYHLVTWFTAEHSNDDIQRINIRYRQGSIQVNAVMFELTTTQHGNPNAQRQITQCGDGIRQLSESCDFTGSYPSCTIDCEVRAGHDCSVDKLVLSHCWKEQCGDGLRSRGEECDDGNDMDQDGCSSSCMINDTYVCSRRYNSTSYCSPLRQAVTAPHDPMPARLLSQVAGSISSRVGLSSSLDTSERTVLSSGYRPTASILPIILGMVGINIFILR